MGVRTGSPYLKPSLDLFAIWKLKFGSRDWRENAAQIIKLREICGAETRWQLVKWRELRDKFFAMDMASRDHTGWLRMQF